VTRRCPKPAVSPAPEILPAATAVSATRSIARGDPVLVVHQTSVGPLLARRRSASRIVVRAPQDGARRMVPSILNYMPSASAQIYRGVRLANQRAIGGYQHRIPPCDDEGYVALASLDERLSRWALPLHPRLAPISARSRGFIQRRVIEVRRRADHELEQCRA